MQGRRSVSKALPYGTAARIAPGRFLILTAPAKVRAATAWTPISMLPLICLPVYLVARIKKRLFARRAQPEG